MKDGNVMDDLLILSCEEDYAICVPFLEKGYNFVLMLNSYVFYGIWFSSELFVVFIYFQGQQFTVLSYY